MLYISQNDKINNNYGDMLMPFILKQLNINSSFNESDIKLYGVGSILQELNDNYGYIWSSGFIYAFKYIKCNITPYALRGRISLQYTICENKNTIALGDGGLILEKIYKPIVSKKYKLGVMPHYTDIINMRDDPIEKYNIFQSSDVLLIKYNYDVKDIIDMINSCENVISSSLHGIITCDSYHIPHCLFIARESKKCLHDFQKSFKFHDYYSTFEINFTGPKFFLHKYTKLEECLSFCELIPKTKLEDIKENLLISLIKCTNMIISQSR